MKKIPVFPVTVTRFDADGQVVDHYIDIEPPKFRFRKESADVTYTLKVVAEQETGEKIFVSYAQDGVHAADIIEDAYEQHPEWRNVWAERI